MKKYLLLLFLFPIISSAQVDLSIDSVFHRSGVGGHFDKGLEYFRGLNWSDQEQDYSCLITNNGGSDAINVYLRVQVILNGAIYFETFSDSVNVAAGSQDSLFCQDPFSEWQVLNNDVIIRYRLFHDSLDLNQTDDSTEYSFQTFDNTISKFHPSIESGSISPFDFTDTTSFLIGSAYEFGENSTIGGVTVFVDSMINSVSLIYGRIYKLDTVTDQWVFEFETEQEAIVGENKLCIDYVSFNEGDLGLFMVGTYQQNVYFKSIITIDSSEVFASTYGGSPYVYDPSIGHLATIVHHWSDCWGKIEDTGISPSFKLHPNPSSSLVKLSYELNSNQTTEISIVDLNGKTVLNQSVKDQIIGEHTLDLDVSNLSDGVYVVHITGPNSSASERLIIQK